MSVKPKMKSEAGQVQIFLSLIFLALASATVIAYNATNSTLDMSGLATGVPLEYSVQETKTIEVWASTQLTIEPKDNFAQSLLLMDDGTPLQQKEIKFYLNDELIGSALTDENGEIGGTLFIIPSGAKVGNYTLRSNSTYYDPYAQVLISNLTTDIFEVRRDRVIYAVLGIPDPCYKDKVMPVSVFVMDSDNQPVDPDNITINIYYTEGYGLQLWRTITMANMTRNSTGFYTYSEVLNNVLTGSYLAVMKVVYEDKETWDLKAFRIVSGGPYDVWINLLKYEVGQGEYLPFQILIENKGEVDHEDVNVTWWVSGGGQSWASGAGAVNVPAYSNVTYNSSAFIYSYQPFDMYYMNAMVVYDPSQPAVIANATFVVTSGQQPPGGEGGGGGAGGGAVIGGVGPTAELKITKYTPEVTLEVGWAKYPAFEIKNTGEMELKSVTFSVLGVPKEWVDPYFTTIDSLRVNETKSISIKVMVPNGTRAGEYIATITAGNVDARDEKQISLIVFTSREELVSYELKKLKTEFQKLQDEIAAGKRDGKDVSGLDEIVNSTAKQIEIAGNYFRNKMFDDAIKEIYTGWNMINRAREMLIQAPFIRPVLIPVLPDWFLPLLIILLLVILIILVLLRRIRRRFERYLKHARYPEAKSIATLMKKEMESEALINERERLLKMLKLLESERNEGLLSETAYLELKRKNEERLKMIEEKMK